MQKLYYFLSVFLITSAAHAKVILKTERQPGKAPAVQIKIPKNTICLDYPLRCHKNDIHFGTADRPDDYFNFESFSIAHPLRELFENFNKISWIEIDNATKEPRMCKVDIQGGIDKKDGDVTLIFSKGCGLKVLDKDGDEWPFSYTTYEFDKPGNQWHERTSNTKP
jgi:hypothetical protein